MMAVSTEMPAESNKPGAIAPSQPTVHAPLVVGFLVNPLAGLGGRLALKGSDSPALLEQVADAGESMPRRAEQRASRALAPLTGLADRLHFLTWGGAMGENTLENTVFSYQVLGRPQNAPSAAADTKLAVDSVLEAGAQLILFTGGDGTARDVFDVVGQRAPVIAIPAGVKMQSGVFAVSPEAAAALLKGIVEGALISVQPREVRDIDEAALQREVVRSRFYGDLLVPGEGHYLQHTKIGGREDEGLAAAEIAAGVVEQLEPGRLYLIGPGSTTAAIMAHLALPNTLLGVDVICDGEVLLADADESGLLALLAREQRNASIIVTVIGGQGFVFGRGNQQLSAAVIRAVGRENVMIVCTKSKLSQLEGRPLRVDTNDRVLDAQFAGLRSVVTGYDDQVLVRVSDELV